MIRAFLYALALVAFSHITRAQWPNPLPCTGVCNNSRDPALIRRDDGTWFRFATSEGIPIFTASNFSGPWEQQGYVLPQCSKIPLPGSCDVWAPDVTLVDDTFYMYYSVSQIASQASAIGVATSKSLEADSWTDHGMLLESKPFDEFNSIDANLLITDESKRLLTYGSYWTGIFQVELGQFTEVIDTVQMPGTHLASLRDTLIPYIEGAFLFKWDQLYYLFFSSGICCGHDKFLPPPDQEYKVKVCRSKSPDRDFIDKDGTKCLDSGGTLVLGSHDNVYSPGGQAVYNISGYGPVLYYHYNDREAPNGLADAEKRIGMNALDFSSGWPAVKEMVYSDPNDGDHAGTPGNGGRETGLGSAAGNKTQPTSGSSSSLRQNTLFARLMVLLFMFECILMII
jgi:arabinan endo-1,5-alpha-L-arabinosidase